MNSIVAGAQGSGILPFPPQASQEGGRPPCTDQGCTCVWCRLRVTQEPLLLQASYSWCTLASLALWPHSFASAMGSVLQVLGVNQPIVLEGD